MTQSLKNKYPLLALNTFGIAVDTHYYFAYDSEEVLQNVLPQVNALNKPILIIGEGSNLLFLSNYDGVVLHSEIDDCTIVEDNEEDVIVRVGSGMIWDDFVAWAVDNDFGGVENLSSIPGTIGASPVQNVGAYGIEAKDVIVEVEAIELSTGDKRVFSNSDCKFSYRDSVFKNELKGKYAVTYVSFKLNKQPVFNVSYGNIMTMLDGREPSLSLIREVITEVRNSKLPDHKILGNAGSFFTNPFVSIEVYKDLIKEYEDMPHYKVNDTTVKVPAGWLIDKAGLKGYSYKNAAVHQDQALVLVNKGGATGSEVLELAHIVIDKVKAMFGITLVPEVNVL